LQFKRRPQAAAPSTSAPRMDPRAVMESTGGTIDRFTSSRDDVHVEYKRQATYPDGSIKLLGVTIVSAERGSGKRSFKVTAKEGSVGQNETALILDGDVQLAASDGMTVRTDHATYADADKTVRAPGAVSFTRGRIS